MDKIIRYTQNEAETVQLAGTMAGHIQAPLVVFLRGELGTGKTTFVRGLLRGMGYTGIVKSPTYTLVEPYEIEGRIIYHFDLYRITDPEELEYAGGRDYFSDFAICLVEWPERATGALPEADIEVELCHQASGREMVFVARSTPGEKVMLATFSQ